MVIKKMYLGEKEILEITTQQFLDNTEGRGCYKKGTALNILKQYGKVETDVAQFWIEK